MCHLETNVEMENQPSKTHHFTHHESHHFQVNSTSHYEQLQQKKGRTKSTVFFWFEGKHPENANSKSWLVNRMVSKVAWSDETKLPT